MALGPFKASAASFSIRPLALLDHGLGARLLAHVGEAQALGVTQQGGAVQTLHQRHGVGRSRMAMAIQRQQTAHGLRRGIGLCRRGVQHSAPQSLSSRSASVTASRGQ